MWWALLVAAAAAVAALIGLSWRPRPHDDAPAPAPAFDWAIAPAYAIRDAGATPALQTHRDRAAIGERLKVRGPIPGGQRFALRIFRDDALVFHCPPGCAVSSGRLELDIAFGVVGRYDGFVALSPQDLPAPSGGGRAAEVARATAAGARIFEIPSIDVR